MPYSLAVKNRATQFIKDYGNGIAQAVKGTGLFFPAIVAQKALESGWGQSSLTKEANNFGGIKYAPSLPGVTGFVLIDAHEENGMMSRQNTLIKTTKDKNKNYDRFRNTKSMDS